MTLQALLCERAGMAPRASRFSMARVMARAMHMTCGMKTHSFRTALLERRRALLARYRDELDRAVEELESREIEETENAGELWDARVLSTLGNTDWRALGRIVSALRRIDNGQFGHCIDCDSVIDAARLVALPETELCFDCALAAELGEIRRASRAPSWRSDGGAHST
jgi:DnaK suppressor protein